MTMFDVVDVCLLQKFVIEDFKDRHKINKELDAERKARSAEEGTEHTPVSKYKINLQHMPSAQINQMTAQLKERVELVRKYYGMKTRQEIKEKTGVDVTYDDLISKEDGKFWAELCKRDFRRLEKYQRLNLGEGHFLEESDEPDSEEEKARQEPQKEEREADSLEGLLFQRDRDDEDFDQNKFLEETMKKNLQFVAQYEADEKTKQMQELIKEMEQQQQKDVMEAQFADNNFWRVKSAAATDQEVDDLLRELEDDGNSQAQQSPVTQEAKSATEASEQSEGSDK